MRSKCVVESDLGSGLGLFSTRLQVYVFTRLKCVILDYITITCKIRKIVIVIIIIIIMPHVCLRRKERLEVCYKRVWDVAFFWKNFTVRSFYCQDRVYMTIAFPLTSTKQCLQRMNAVIIPFFVEDASSFLMTLLLFR